MAKGKGGGNAAIRKNALKTPVPPCETLPMVFAADIAAPNLEAEMLILCARIGFSPPPV